MSQPADSDDSRTQSFRGKRTLAVAKGEDSSASSPSKRSKRGHRGPQHHRDFVPQGGSFSNSAQLINAASPDGESSSNSSAVSAHDPESHRARSIDTEGSTDGPSTTAPSLPGDRTLLGQNRLITGFTKIHPQPGFAAAGNASEVSRNDSTSRNSIGESVDDAIEISDDTDMEDQSEDGGMMINVDDESVEDAYTTKEDDHVFHTNLTVGGVVNQPSPRNECSLSEGEVKQLDKEERPPTARAKRKKCANCGKKGHKKGQCPPNRQNLKAAPAAVTHIHGDYTHEQLQGDNERFLPSNSITTPNTGPGPAPPRLGDLPTPELEKQVRYTLFHLKRDQIDLNRPAICTTCLQPGHRESECPERNCAHCGVKDEHPRRMCPKYRRCLKCRERGHDVDTCISKLKNTTVPCDHCGSDAHLEDSCPTRFFPSRSQAAVTGLKLWISCCICASKTHLVGDCPQRRASTQAAAWSLRSFDPLQISNLSLESGTRKIERDVEIRGARQQDLMIKGRAELYGNAAAPSLRPPVRKPDDPPRVRNRRAATSRHDFREDSYRPSLDSYSRTARNDRYEPSYTDYRDQPSGRRDKFYDTDSFGQRRRSRSPLFRNTGSQQRNDNFRPPLPNEPLPSRPPPPPRQGSRPSASANRTQDRGPPGVDSYRPMPSAAKQAWDKLRL
jgi:protein AIR1/2